MKHNIFFFLLCSTSLCWSAPKQKIRQKPSNPFVKFICTKMEDHTTKKRLIDCAHLIDMLESITPRNTHTITKAQQNFLSCLLPTADDHKHVKQLPILENYEEPHPYDLVIKTAARLLLEQRAAAIARLNIGLQAHTQIEQQLDELKRQEKERLADLAQKIKDNNHVTYDN